MKSQVYINAIGTSCPPHDIHPRFVDYVKGTMDDARQRALFSRMANRSGIASRASIFAPDYSIDKIDSEGFYKPGSFPGTAERMQRFAIEAPRLAIAAVQDLLNRHGEGAVAAVSHLITVTCTGFMAPGIDIALMDEFEISNDVERTHVGFMGCNAAFNAFKLARHIVRSDPRARVLVVNVELCTLHFQQPGSVDEALMYLLFGDAASAALISSDASGLRLDCFGQTILPGTRDQITWGIGSQGFGMFLSGDVPRHIGNHLPAHVAALLGQDRVDDIELWAVHPGGRSVLASVETALDLPEAALASSRKILNEFGNVSSVTVPFILNDMMAGGGRGRRGVALGFGPGLGVESFTFAEVAS